MIREPSPQAQRSDEGLLIDSCPTCGLDRWWLTHERGIYSGPEYELLTADNGDCLCHPCYGCGEVLVARGAGDFCDACEAIDDDDS